MTPRSAVAALAFLFLAPPFVPGEEKKPVAYEVPFRLGDTRHIIVRARLNGKGPFNLIVDTGAPALYLTPAVAKKIGATADKNGWTNLTRFELEGGLVVDKARGRVEDVPQIIGMNSLGAAGVELHGLMGYHVLSGYRIEYDLTRDKMTWTPVDHPAEMPEKLGKGTPTGLEVMGSVLKIAGLLLGRGTAPKLAPRGFLGVELADSDDGITVKAVLASGPAAQAGVQAGDRITRFGDKPVRRLTDVYPLAAKIVDGDPVQLTIQRGTTDKPITLKAGKGL